MTRTLALDAYRYVSREYTNPAAQCAKMERKHGTVDWLMAWSIAMTVYKSNSDQCAAVVVGKIEERLR